MMDHTCNGYSGYYIKHYPPAAEIGTTTMAKPMGLYVGWVKASDADREVLELNGIDTSHADFNEEAKHLFRCLFSETVALELSDLDMQGKWRFAFECSPSVAMIELARADASHQHRPTIPVERYLIPPTVVELAEAVRENLIPSTWRRRGFGRYGVPTQ